MVTAKESRPEPMMSSIQKEKMNERTRDLAGRKPGDEDDSLVTVPYEMPEYYADKELHFAKKIAKIKEGPTGTALSGHRRRPKVGRGWFGE